MYRAITWAMLTNGVDVNDPTAIARAAGNSRITSLTDPGAPGIWVDDVDVAEPIRSEVITGAVSAVSAVPEVRERLVADQRAQVAASVEAGRGIVVEGRDIGTVVVPDAPLKIYLIADPEVRARRRALEHSSGAPVGGDALVETQDALVKRDELDSGRAVSPLSQAEDATVLDTSFLTLDEVIARVCTLAEETRS